MQSKPSLMAMARLAGSSEGSWFRQRRDRDGDSEALWTGDSTIRTQCDWNIDQLLLKQPLKESVLGTLLRVEGKGCIRHRFKHEHTSTHNREIHIKKKGLSSNQEEIISCSWTVVVWIENCPIMQSWEKSSREVVHNLNCAVFIDVGQHDSVFSQRLQPPQHRRWDKRWLPACLQPDWAVVSAHLSAVPPRSATRGADCLPGSRFNTFSRRY